MLTFTVSFHLRPEEDTLYRWFGANDGVFFPAVVIKCHTHAEQAVLQREAHLDINNTHIGVCVCVLIRAFSEHKLWEDCGQSVLI